MNSKWLLTTTAAALVAFAPVAAFCGTDGSSNVHPLNPQVVGQIVPGHSTKVEIKSLLGEPWRIIQFNDCGEAMDDQADETWEYRGNGPNGPYRLHVEFNDQGTVHLLATIPDKTLGGKATNAKVAPTTPSSGMSM
jgi:hypothetical protein